MRVPLSLVNGDKAVLLVTGRYEINSQDPCREEELEEEQEEEDEVRPLWPAEGCPP